MSDSKRCYWPSSEYGEIESSENYVPCRNTTNKSDHTACCSSSDYCFSNGLCLDPSTMVPYRGGCTDENFQDGECPKICLKYPTRSGVWPCDGDTGYACDPDGCFNSSLIFTLPAGSVLPGLAVNRALDLALTTTAAATTTTSSIGAETTAPSPSASSATATPSPNAQDSTNIPTCPVSKGTVAGVGAGIGVPLFLALLVALFFLFRERKKSRRPVSMSDTHQPPSSWGRPPQRVELDTSDAPTEIESSRPSSFRPK